MKETKHTPGPWEVEQITVLEYNVTRDKVVIATVLGKANAKLIAAAPEMYEVCKVLADCLLPTKDNDKPDSQNVECFIDLGDIRKAVRVITKFTNKRRMR